MAARWGRMPIKLIIDTDPGVGALLIGSVGGSKAVASTIRPPCRPTWPSRCGAQPWAAAAPSGCHLCVAAVDNDHWSAAAPWPLMPGAAVAAATSPPPSCCRLLCTDDSMAILAAFNSPEIEVLGLTSMYGNVPTTMATRNALTLCQLAGRPEVR